MKIFECVLFILLRDGEMLLEKRKLTKEGDPGLIVISGGHCEKGKSVEQALLRELYEELSIKPVNYHYICTLFHQSEEFQKIHYYAIHKWSVKFKIMKLSFYHDFRLRKLSESILHPTGWQSVSIVEFFERTGPLKVILLGLCL